jgi:hypothetical protein
MRTYRLKAGMRERFLEVFRTRSVPEHHRLGMKILGPFLSIEDSDTRSSSCAGFRTCLRVKC